MVASMKGSVSELEYQLLLARDLDYLPADAHAHLAEQVTEVRRMLYRFIQSLNVESG
jgi:four helix bundle protein